MCIDCRLEFLDAHQGDKQQAEPEVEFQMSLPPLSAYKDLHAGMRENLPTITVGRLNDYLGQFNKPLDNKVKDLYNERFVRYVRVASDENGGLKYISSVVWAEMRKSIAYRVDLSVDKDGVVQQAQCECGAGQGPSAHCKHVAAVLYGVTNFCETGDILTELTCTQKLQQFHKSQAFKGSPIKANGMQQLRGKNSQPPLSYDPRPANRRNCIAENTDRMRAACINGAMESKNAMPSLQMFPPANIPGICHDHDYMARTAEEAFLEDNMISHITEQQVAEVEERTRGQGRNAEWRKVRLHHITSSNFGSICKATEKKNLAAYAEHLTTHRELKTKAILHGQKYERVAVEKCESKWGIKTQECGIFVSEQYSYLAASPDRIVDEDTVLEIKCPYTSRQESISSQTVPYLKTTTDGVLTLDRNHDHYYQIQGQLLCSNRKLCIFVVYTFNDIIRVDIERDEAFITEMVKKLEGFYSTYFKPAVIKKFLYRDYDDYNFE